MKEFSITEEVILLCLDQLKPMQRKDKTPYIKGKGEVAKLICEPINKLIPEELRGVLKEYKEMREKHGYTKEHDLKVNTHGELLQAAESLLSPEKTEWPDNWDLTVFGHIRRKPEKERLSIIIAFILAEIVRINGISENSITR